MENRFSRSFLGKTILIASTYILYWLIFYGSWFIMPERWFLEYDSEIYKIQNNIIFVLLFVIIPILSFFIPHYISKKIQINKKLLYLLHIILIIFSLWLFLHIGLTIAFHHFQIG